MSRLEIIILKNVTNIWKLSDDLKYNYDIQEPLLEQSYYWHK